MSLRLKKSRKYDEDIEITFIRSDTTIPWPYKDEELAQMVPVKPVTTLFVEKQNKEITPCTSYSSLEVHYDSDSTLTDLSISNFGESKQDIYRKRCKDSSRSRFRTKKRTRIEPTILNQFLDLLTVCFWKCSTGCQQIPDKQ